MELVVYVVVSVKVICKLEFINNLVCEWTVTHFFFRCFCVGVTFDFCVLGSILFFSLCVFCNGKPLFLAMVRIIFHYCCFVYYLIASAILLFM